MCTIVTISKNGEIWAGNNEDFLEPRTKIWFFPATKDKYGRVYVGFDRYLMPYQGGMNEAGLFLDMNAVNPTGWQPDPNKPIFNGCIIDHMLSFCATVEEVVDFFRHNNVPLDNVRVPVADANGHSVIIEWAHDEIQFVYKQGDYQISTNYVQSNYARLEDYPCQRYKIADKILKNADQADVNIVRAVLSATHFEFLAQTLYSNICDLKRKRIYLYHFHNFEEVVVFNLNEELKKGEAAYPIPSLFSTQPFSVHLFSQIGPQVGARDLMTVIETEGIQEGLKQFHSMHDQSRTINRYLFEEWILRDLGFSLLQKKKVEEALEIFKLAVEMYPESWETYDNLGEVYRLLGEKGNAIECYKKVLAMDPGNPNASNMLKTLFKTDLPVNHSSGS
jgi:tetratricopeptide (TPR) repeat protein